MIKKPEIPKGYRCPFCSDHQDYDFVWSELAEAYLCEGCYHEIDQGLDYDHQPTIEEINCAGTIEKLLEHLGICYAELRQRQKRLGISR